MRLAASRRRIQRAALAWAMGLSLLAPAGGDARSDDRDPALAPPLEELQAEADRWRQRRRTGALVLLGSLAVASGVIGWARHRARGERRRRLESGAPVDKRPPGPPR